MSDGTCIYCEGDGYVDIVEPETGGVIGPRPCPDCGGTGERSEDDHA